MSEKKPSHLSLGQGTWEKLRALKEQAAKEKKELLVSPKKLSPNTHQEDSTTGEKGQTPKKSWAEKRGEYQAVIEWLCHTFPCAFNGAHSLPLKLQITKDLYPHLPTDGSFSKVRLRASIQYYTRSTLYLQSLLNATHRVDLEGQAVEPIMESHKEFTQSLLNQRQERKKAFKPKKIVRKPFPSTIV